jgi:hypothetical protein
MDPEPAPRLFSAAPAALGGAAVACAQKSSPHKHASRTRSMSIMVKSQDKAFASNSGGVVRLYIQEYYVEAPPPKTGYPDGPSGKEGATGSHRWSTILQQPLSLVRHCPRTSTSPTHPPARGIHMPFPTATHVSLVLRVR